MGSAAPAFSRANVTGTKTLSGLWHCRVTVSPAVTSPLWWTRREGLGKFPGREGRLQGHGEKPWVPHPPLFSWQVGEMTDPWSYPLSALTVGRRFALQAWTKLSQVTLFCVSPSPLVPSLPRFVPYTCPCKTLCPSKARSSPVTSRRRTSLGRERVCGGPRL